MSRISANDIELFATNTGELYQTHLAMARRGAAKTEWFDHIRDVVLPLYRKQIGNGTVKFVDELFASQDIKAYYEQHVSEF